MMRTSQKVFNFKGGRSAKIGLCCTPQVKEKFLAVLQAQDITQADWIEDLALHRLPGYRSVDDWQQPRAASHRYNFKGGRTMQVAVRCTPTVKALFRRVGHSTQGDIFEQFVLEDWEKLRPQ